MLDDSWPPPLSPRDLDVYETVVPHDHYLRKAAQVIPWPDFYDILAPYYSPDMGRPAEPLLMLKLEFLRYHHNLSDREVIIRCVTDLAFRQFLGVPLRGYLPDSSSLCKFRGRLGTEGFRKVFDQVVHIAREHGMVKDRLRLKDATHVIANSAIPTAIVLVAQARDKLLAAAQPFEPLMVEGERVNAEMLHEATKHLNLEERLVTRVAQLRDILLWADELAPPEDPETNRDWQTFLDRRALAHKILKDQDHPDAGDRTLSTTDPDARCGKHGDFFDGYLLDISMDADSEIITSINVLPAGSDEAADTLELIRLEEEAHHNDVKAMSIDGIGFNGPLLRELEDPKGLNIDTYVPPPQDRTSDLFTPQDFPEDKQLGVVTCPAGQTSTYRTRDDHKDTTKYHFPTSVCRGCALQSRCMTHPPKKHGRTVCKTDYQTEHDRARQKATTQQYLDVRREHPKVERKLGELMNRHNGRQACYRGRPKVLLQELMVATATNVKRIVRWLCAPTEQVSYAT